MTHFNGLIQSVEYLYSDNIFIIMIKLAWLLYASNSEDINMVLACGEILGGKMFM